MVWEKSRLISSYWWAISEWGWHKTAQMEARRWSFSAPRSSVSHMLTPFPNRLGLMASWWLAAMSPSKSRPSRRDFCSSIACKGAERHSDWTSWSHKSLPEPIRVGGDCNVLIDLSALPSPVCRVMKVEYQTQGNKPQMTTRFYSVTQVTRYFKLICVQRSHLFWLPNGHWYITYLFPL